jgi:hypothetical protein
MRRALTWIRPRLPDLSDLLGIAGAGVLVRGIALVYVPAAWIAGGLLALAAGVLLARQERRR